MKRTMLMTIAAFAMATATAYSQGSIPVRTESADGQKTGGQQSMTTFVRSSGARTISSMLAFGSFSVGGEDRFGPTFIIQYSPDRLKFPAVDFFAGVLVQTGTSGPVDTREYIPVASMVAPYYSPYSNYRNNDAFWMSHLSIGLAFLGSDLTFYMAEGSVRPYVGVGGSLALWSYSHQLSGTFAPDAKVGLAIRVANSFSGFAEVRKMFGVPNLLGSDMPKFDGMTSAAIGISFAPRFR